MAQEFHTLAAARPDPFDRLIGERMIATAQYFLGELFSARRHIERVLVHDDEFARASQSVRFEVDQRVAAQAYFARILWLQGLPDQAMRVAERSVAGALETNQAISMGLALARAACPIALLTGDLAAAEHYVGMLLDHSTRHVLALWHAFGRCCQAMLAIQRGDLRVGLPMLRAVLDEPGAGRAVPQLFGFVMAEALGRAGQISDALAAIEEAMERSERTEERWLTAELLRVKGEILVWRGAPRAAAEAESHFRQALDLARQQGALSWELRAATSLARLWRGQARSKEAYELLAPVYDRFTEGFATADLRTAKSLIEEIS
jgi:predicted ATPase